MLKTLPKTLEVHYDNPNQWLARMVGWRSWGNHPWCTDLCTVLYFNLHKMGETSILVNNKPIISYVIDIAKQTNKFNKIYINSDHKIFKTIAECFSKRFNPYIRVTFYKLLIHLK